MSRSRLVLVTASIVAAALGATAAGAGTGAPARFSDLTATAARLYAVRDGALVEIDGPKGTGTRPACRRLLAPAATAAAARPAPDLDADDALALADLPDDDAETPEAEDVLDDEGLLSGTRRRSPEPGRALEIRALAAAAGGDAIWIATSAGLFRGDGDGCALVGLGARDLVAVAAGPGGVAVASDGLAWRLDPQTNAFTVAAGLTARPRALALAADGTIAVGDDEGLVAIAPGGRPERLLETPVDAAITCGDVTLFLASDGAYVWTAGAAPLRAGDRPPARALACGPAPDARFVATGVGTWTSDDGATWRERPETVGLSVNGAAARGGSLWVALDDGVRALDEGVDAEHAARNAATPLQAPAAAVTTLPPLAPPAARGPWSLPWPRVTLAFVAQRTPVRARWEALILVTIPFGRSPRPSGAATQIAAARAERDAALAAAAIAFGARGDDESAAVARAIAQEREALRP